MSDGTLFQTDEIQTVYNPLHFDEKVGDFTDPLTLDIPDDELEKIVTQRIEASEKFYKEKYNLRERRQKNEKYLFGRQIAELEKQGKLKDYETRSNYNALYEIEASLKPLAMSKLPDMIITPGGEDPERVESAKNLTLVVNDVNKHREQREVLGLAFKHLPVYFTAVLKSRWDSERGKKGDLRFDVIHPEYIVVDHTASSRNVDDMSYVAQVVPMTVQEVLMKFPSKKEQFFKELQSRGIVVDGKNPTSKELATEVKPWEVWFDWFKRKGQNELVNKSELTPESLYEPGVKWERVCGVLWKFEHLILDKMKDPNFDYEGEKKLFIVDPQTGEKQEIQPEEVVMAQLQGVQLPIEEETAYHNYFDRPHKPFYFFGYDQWGKIAYDETSRIEQNLQNQENLDEQNKTIMDQLKQRMKHIWSRDSGLDKAAIQRLDMEDPKMDAIVDNNPNDVHKGIAPERPDSAQFNALSDTKQGMYAISGSTAVRGQLESDVATSNQIAREADFTRSDDLVEETINSAAQWMAEWQMQFIKLRYTEEHITEIIGSKGKATYIRLRRDVVSDGMEVQIKASSTDKLKAQRNAMESAKLGPPYSNPLDFFQDMGMDDVDGRVKRGMMLAVNPEGFYTEYVLGLENPQQLAGALNASPPGAQPQPVDPSQPPGAAQPQQAAPQAPSPADTTQVAAQPPVAPQGSPRLI